MGEWFDDFLRRLTSGGPEGEAAQRDALDAITGFSAGLHEINERLVLGIPEGRLRAALLWWTVEKDHMEDDARTRYEEILKDEKRMRARFLASSFDAADSTKLAGAALRDHRAEIEYYLTDPSEHTVQKIAEILRRHHGHEVEELLPLAKRFAREAAGPTGPDLDGLTDLPKADRDRLVADFALLKSKQAMEEYAAKFLDREKERLRGLGLSEEEEERKFQHLKLDVEQRKTNWCRERGLT